MRSGAAADVAELAFAVEALLEIVRERDAVLRELVRWDDECNATGVLEDGGRNAIADEARKLLGLPGSEVIHP